MRNRLRKVYAMTKPLHVCLWRIVNMLIALLNICYWGKSGLVLKREIGGTNLKICYEIQWDL